jgi:hypothetical protein
MREVKKKGAIPADYDVGMAPFDLIVPTLAGLLEKIVLRGLSNRAGQPGGRSPVHSRHLRSSNSDLSRRRPWALHPAAHRRLRLFPDPPSCIVSTLKLASDRVIDACVFGLPDGTWRMWYNNERGGKSIYFADSADLIRRLTFHERGQRPGRSAGKALRSRLCFSAFQAEGSTPACPFRKAFRLFRHPRPSPQHLEKPRCILPPPCSQGWKKRFRLAQQNRALQNAVL